MAFEMPCLTYMTLYFITVHVLQTNSRTSTHWKLNLEEDRIVDSTASSLSEVDPIMSILTSKIIVNDEGEWRLVEEGSCSAENCLQSEESNYSLSAEKKSSSSSKQR